jgi:hypothetical protein
MANPIKYSTGSETLALKKGNFYIGTGDVGKGPTSSTGYYNGISPPTGGYTIYLNKETGGPSIYTASNDAQLISLTNSIAGQSYTTANECLVYFAGQTDKMVLNRNYEGIVTDGLVLNVDAGFTPSYPKNGTTWYDVSGTNNGTLTNGPTFNSDNGGGIVFDGVDDYVKVPINLTYSQGTISCWVYPKSTGDNFFVYTNNNPTSTYTHQLGIRSSNKLYAYIYDGGLKQFEGTSTMNTNEWYHCVFWWKDNMAFGSYLNGVSQGSLSVGTAWKSGSNFWIGSNAGGPSGVNGFLNGEISNLQIYNRQLTSSEILQNYNAQKGRFGL